MSIALSLNKVHFISLLFLLLQLTSVQSSVCRDQITHLAPQIIKSGTIVENLNSGLTTFISQVQSLCSSCSLACPFTEILNTTGLTTPGAACISGITSNLQNVIQQTSEATNKTNHLELIEVVYTALSCCSNLTAEITADQENESNDPTINPIGIYYDPNNTPSDQEITSEEDKNEEGNEGSDSNGESEGGSETSSETFSSGSEGGNVQDGEYDLYFLDQLNMDVDDQERMELFKKMQIIV